MRYELTDYEWAAIKPMLPNKPRGVPRVNDRRVLNGILWVLRSGALALHRALVAHRVPTSLYVYPHGSHSWPGAQGRAALRRTEAFLRRWLG